MMSALLFCSVTTVTDGLNLGKMVAALKYGKVSKILAWYLQMGMGMTIHLFINLLEVNRKQLVWQYRKKYILKGAASGKQNKLDMHVRRMVLL